jgi:prepilin-type N-terminal cleavage/methylation domain-containing protein
MKRRPNRAGFTLVEVLVGLVVGGIVMLAGFAAVSTVQDRSLHAREATTSALEGATARTLLVNWLSTATLQGSEIGVLFEGLDATEQGLPSDEITFPTRFRTPLRVPMTGVRLFVDADPETGEVGLVAEMVGAVDDVPIRMELAPQVTGLLIRYLPVAEGPVEWAESWVGQQSLPRAVEITLLYDPEDPLPPLLRLPIRVALATLQ